MAQTTFVLNSNFTWDAQCGYHSAGAWPPTGGTFEQTSGNATVRLRKSGGPPYASLVAMFKWDTSSIPDGDTITEAMLRVFAWDQAIQNDNGYSVVGDYYEPTIPPVTGDYIETANPSIFTAIPLSGITINQWLEIPLTNFSGISKTGITGIRLTLSAGTPSGNNEVLFTDCNNGDGNDAELVVTHGEEAPPEKQTFYMVRRRTVRR